MIKGVYTALVTPFDESGQLDKEGLKFNVKRQMTAGVDGLLALGTTGEASTLTVEEQKLVISEVVKASCNALPVMVGVGTNCTRTTIEAAKRAEALGASSLLVVVPYYSCPEEEGIYRHIEAVSQATALPICLYHHPKRTGTQLTVSFAKRLASLPKVIAWKDASGDLEFVDQLLQETVGISGFTILTGNDQMLLAHMALGGDGVISVVSNLSPKPVVTLVKAANLGNFSEARRWHRELAPIIKGTFLYGNPASIKAMMHFAKLSSATVRLPLMMPGMSCLEKLRSIVKTHFREEVLV